jgi:hypothetical protein
MNQSGHRDPPIKQKAPDATGALNWVSCLQHSLFRTLYFAHSRRLCQFDAIAWIAHKLNFLDAG